MKSAESLPVLYSFRRCPYAIRARLTLRYAGISCALREVVLGDKPPELIACSPKATVPVLVLDSGEVIDESLDIMLWALGQNDPDGWLDIDTAAANQLIDTNDGEFKAWLDRYKYPEWHPDSKPEECRARCEVFLDEIDRRLRQQAYVCGDRLSLADVALLPFLRQFAFVDIDWFRSSRYGSANEWLQRFLKSDLFASVMHKYPLWRDTGIETTF